MHTLLYIKQISNQDLLYGTENYTRYSVINYMEKESEKEWIYIYIYIYTHTYTYVCVNHPAVHLKLTQHCKSTMCMLSCFKHVRLFTTLWTVAHQVLLSMEFSRKGYLSGLPFPPPGNFPTQGLNPGLPYCRQMLYRLSHQGSSFRYKHEGRAKKQSGKILKTEKFLVKVFSSQQEDLGICSICYGFVPTPCSYFLYACVCLFYYEKKFI